MLSQALSETDLTMLPVITLILFILVFGGVLASVLAGGGERPRHEKLAGLPLADDAEVAPSER